MYSVLWTTTGSTGSAMTIPTRSILLFFSKPLPDMYSVFWSTPSSTGSTWTTPTRSILQ